MFTLPLITNETPYMLDGHQINIRIDDITTCEDDESLIQVEYTLMDDRDHLIDSELIPEQLVENFITSFIHDAITQSLSADNSR
jgi:hypothetical protein